MQLSRRWWIIAAAVVIVLPALITLLVTHRSTTHKIPIAIPPSVDRTSTKIPVQGGTLVAEVFSLHHHEANAPLVVMPTPWGSDVSTYDGIASKLAAKGYDVVSYTQRGFETSSGLIDFAGTRTQADAHTVITWALDRTRANPQRIGMFGVSYGAGISLITAAHDPRIKAVVALSTWADMASSFEPNGTPSTLAVGALVTNGRGRFDSSVEPFVKSVGSPSDFTTQLKSISPARSPETYTAQLNKNAPAVFLANGFEDSIFPPQQLIGFFDKLTTPKRLQLAEGDHGGPELNALQGKPDATVTSAIQWLDHYLRGVDNGANTQAPIQLRDVITHAVHGYSTWPATTSADVEPLGTPSSTDAIGSSGAWSTTISSGTSPGSGFNATLNIQYGHAYVLPLMDTHSITPHSAAVFTGPTLAANSLVSGTPAVHLDVTSSGTSATVYAYLYDVDGHTAGLMSMEPYTVQTTPNTATTVSFSMQPISWTVRKGHHLMLLLDTANLRYQSPTPAGTKITFSSTASDQATVTIPTQN